ncbi:MAG: hypothetical protein ABSD98_04060 [Candidatus Korobacteraceae bacterium]
MAAYRWFCPGAAMRISQEQYKNDFRGNKNEALKHALDIRKFEIELYWKRATYFWTFIGAALAGYGAVQVTSVASTGVRTDLSVILSCLGFVVSYGWFCANKGSKQWQENWENHVDMLEDEDVGPLYKTVLKRPKEEGRYWLVEFINGPAPYSVSKINQIISLFVTILWSVLLWRALPPFSMSARVNKEYAVIVGMSVTTCIAFHLLGQTDGDSERTIVADRRRTEIDPIEEKSTAQLPPSEDEE